MTDKGNNNNDRESPYRPEWGVPNGNRDSLSDGPTDPSTDRDDLDQEEWKQLPSDPDLAEDLGYAFSEWEEFATLDDSEAVIFLPADEEVLQQDAFVVVAEDSMVDLGQQY